MATFGYGTSLAKVGTCFPNLTHSSKPLPKHPVYSASTKPTASAATKSSLSVSGSRGRRSTCICRRACLNSGIMASAVTEIEKLGIKIVRNPPESKLSELGVSSWPKWGCPPSNFPWTYSAKETCYLLKGKVKVYPEGSDEAVEIGAGDLVVFPKGMSCTWDVSVAVDKHYQFE